MSLVLPWLMSFCVFINMIFGHIFMSLTWRVRSFLGYLFVKFQVFFIKATDNCFTIKELGHIFPWNPRPVASQKHQSKQKHVQSRRQKDSRTNLLACLYKHLGTYFQGLWGILFLVKLQKQKKPFSDVLQSWWS